MSITTLHACMIQWPKTRIVFSHKKRKTMLMPLQQHFPSYRSGWSGWSDLTTSIPWANKSSKKMRKRFKIKSLVGSSDFARTIAHRKYMSKKLSCSQVDVKWLDVQHCRGNHGKAIPRGYIHTFLGHEKFFPYSYVQSMGGAEYLFGGMNVKVVW